MERDGSLRQTGMTVNQGAKQVNLSMFYPLRGVVTGVRFKDTTKAKQTLVDIYLYHGYHQLYNVPIGTQAINKSNGEEDTPEKGNIVLVSFVGGREDDPIVICFIPSPDNEIQATSAESPRYYRKRNGTHETWDKDGNRTTHVAKDDSLNVEGKKIENITGDNTETVGGKKSETIDGNNTEIVKGNKIETVTGTRTVKSTGAGKLESVEKNEIIGGDGVDIDGGSGSSDLAGCVNMKSICPFIGSFHIDGSSNVKVTKGS